LREIGRVVEISGGNRIVASVERTEACAKCRACAVGLRKKDMLVNARISASEKIELNERVSLELPEGAFMNAVWLMYGIPALLFVAGCVAGYALFGGESDGLGALAGVLLGAVLVAASYYTVKTLVRRKAERYTPDARKIDDIG